MFFKQPVYFIGYLIVGKLFFFDSSLAQETADTAKIHRLNEVEIQAAPLPPSYKSGSPLQVWKADDWNGAGALQVSDVVKFFSGAQVKDYGGVGGLKTVSIRSLGANYTNVACDGVAVSDYQTGQIDLGRFSLDNVEMITFQIGENDEIFQTAQMQSFAGTVNIISQTFPSNEKKNNHVKASLKAGSFGFVNPSFRVGQRIHPAFSANLSADYTRTDGNYPFRQTIGYDNQTEKRIRNNSDVEALKLESNLTGTFENNGRLAFKMYYYGSERGLPGAAIYYMDYSGERLKDRNAFAQARYEQPLNEKVDFMAHAKVNFSTIDYTDVQNFYPGGEKESHYEQREYYLNTTVLYQLSRHLSFSWANDGIAGNFRSNLPNNVFPSRTAWLSALSGQYEAAIFTLTAKLLYTAIDDRAKIGNAPADYSHFSPYLSFSVHPLKNIPLRLRGFYKNSFRMPTFGDLYYSIRPTLNLKPENAHQYNAGLTFAASGNRLFSLISFSGDLYRYRIENKIVAIPKSSLFSQSIQNYGKVETTGVDMSLKIHLQTGKRLLWKINGTYTYQKVLDKTDPNTGIYNQQIPYTPCHTASGYIRLETPWINFNYTLLYSGKRYYERVNRREFQMNAFTEQGIALTKNMRRKNVSYILKAECANLFNVPYEVVRSYPMPGRSFRFGINLNY